MYLFYNSTILCSIDTSSFAPVMIHRNSSDIAKCAPSAKTVPGFVWIQVEAIALDKFMEITH